MADILDAAKKQINDTATTLASNASPSQPLSDQSSNPPQLKEEALLDEPKNTSQLSSDQSITSQTPTSDPTSATQPADQSPKNTSKMTVEDPAMVTSIMESVLSTDPKQADSNVSMKKEDTQPALDSSTPMQTPAVEDLTPTVLPPPNQPKHGKSGPIIAVVLFLLLTLPLGVFFVSQQQQIAEVRSKAAVPGPYPTTTATPPSSTPTPDYENFDYITFSCDKCGSDGRCQTEIGTNPQFSTGANPGSCNQVDRRPKGESGDWQAVSLCDSSCSGGGESGTSETQEQEQNDKDKDKDKSNLECKKIKIYKGEEEVDNPSTLKPGDQIVVAVKGKNAKKARIRINGTGLETGDWTVTDTKNDKGEFTLSFTIPANAVNIKIEAEVTKDGKKWE